ncbi:hypothetical protein BvCmsF63A_03209 [Escherichia coli]|uniref:Uncharacterized protein n=1 Tax=Escherichia coli TaxID=562 RepID=A0A478KMV2_ECOLX|nr:hypothetical protein BvCmsH19A_00747 [Escherichia coli]GCK80074.1 hypothetical protein BvCmsF63A_03209 [Escherichia coli]SQY51514.1 Uncharacterised protein [Escherichia coli]
MLGGADNPNGELPSYITGADTFKFFPFIHHRALYLMVGDAFISFSS